MVRRFKSLSDSPYAFWIGSLLWLPAGVMLSAIVRFADQLANPMGWLMLLANLGSLIVVAPCGLPLWLAVAIIRRSRFHRPPEHSSPARHRTAPNRCSPP